MVKIVSDFLCSKLVQKWDFSIDEHDLICVVCFGFDHVDIAWLSGSL